jgi:hypothetical protein
VPVAIELALYHLRRISLFDPGGRGVSYWRTWRPLSNFYHSRPTVEVSLVLKLQSELELTESVLARFGFSLFEDKEVNGKGVVKREKRCIPLHEYKPIPSSGET